MMTNQIKDKLIEAVGGMESFKQGWNWRSFTPSQRAEQALTEACQSYANGLAALQNHKATAEHIEEWTSLFIRKWAAYQHAGARTANPMITGPDNFPVERNRKRIETEMKRGQEYWDFAEGVTSWLARRLRAADRAALSEAAKGVEHKEQQVGDIRVVHNETLDRIQLIFPDKPSNDERAVLKKQAFRWSPREGAWQRKLTQNGINAAQYVLKQLEVVA